MCPLCCQDLWRSSMVCSWSFPHPTIREFFSGFDHPSSRFLPEKIQGHFLDRARTALRSMIGRFLKTSHGKLLNRTTFTAVRLGTIWACKSSDLNDFRSFFESATPYVMSTRRVGSRSKAMTKSPREPSLFFHIGSSP